MTAPAARLDTPRLRIEISRPAHAAGLARFYRDNHEGHLAPWSPPIPPQAFTEEGWAARLGKDAADFEAGLTARWVLLPPDGGDEVIGTANLTQIFRGPFHAAMLGYQLARRHEGRGVMAEALRAVIGHAFGPLRLHRLMANHRPENVRSGALLARLGFVAEGFARDYLFIDGAWRDHVLTSLTNPAFDPAWLEAGRPA